MTFPALQLTRTLKLCIEPSVLPSLMLPHGNFRARLDVDRKGDLTKPSDPGWQNGREWSGPL